MSGDVSRRWVRKGLPEEGQYVDALVAEWPRTRKGIMRRVLLVVLQRDDPDITLKVRGDPDREDIGIDPEPEHDEEDTT